MHRPIRVSVPGATGFWGAYYMNAFAAYERFQIMAVADTAAEMLRVVANHYAVSHG